MLRKIDPTVALPYWDSTLDEPLPRPADSVIFTHHFMGSVYDTTNGYVMDGPFWNWATVTEEIEMFGAAVQRGWSKTTPLPPRRRSDEIFFAVFRDFLSCWWLLTFSAD